MVDEKILPYLSRVSAHYRILELAHAHKLGDDPAPFVERYVFPGMIDEVLELEVARLERRRDLLKAHPYSPPPPMEALDIPTRLELPAWPNPRRVPRPGLNMPVA